MSDGSITSDHIAPSDDAACARRWRAWRDAATTGTEAQETPLFKALDAVVWDDAQDSYTPEQFDAIWDAAIDIVEKGK